MSAATGLSACGVDGFDEEISADDYVAVDDSMTVKNRPLRTCMSVECGERPTTGQTFPRPSTLPDREPLLARPGSSRAWSSTGHERLDAFTQSGRTAEDGDVRRTQSSNFVDDCAWDAVSRNEHQRRDRFE